MLMKMQGKNNGLGNLQEAYTLMRGVCFKIALT